MAMSEADGGMPRTRVNKGNPNDTSSYTTSCKSLGPSNVEVGGCVGGFGSTSAATSVALSEMQAPASC